MKNSILKRFLSFGLVVSLMIGLLSNIAFLPANAEDAQTNAETEIKDVYDYKADFSGTQGQDNWYYNSGDNTKYASGNESEFHGSGDNSYWSLASGKGTRFSKNTFIFSEGYTGKAGIMFEVPKSGTIRIEKKFTISGVDKYLVKYNIMKAEKDADQDGTVDLEELTAPVYPTGDKLGMNFVNDFSTYTTYSNEAIADIDVVTHVEAGQRIIFSMQLNGKANGVVSLDTFTITYVEDVYDYTADFSDVQGKNNWYYNSTDTLKYGADNTTTYFKDTKVWGAAESGGGTQFGDASINFTSTGIAGIMFKAPKTGTIHIEQKITLPSDITTGEWFKYGIYKVDESTNVIGSVFPIGSLTGVNLTHDESNYETYYYKDQPTPIVDITVHVKEGQQIIFAMQSNKTGVKAILDKFRITYAEEVYDYIADFSGVQGMNNWYYNSASNTEYGTNNTSKYDTGITGWTSASGGATWFTKSRFTLNSTNAAGIVFEVPKTGTIRIEKKFAVSSTNASAVMKYSIYKAAADDGTGTVSESNLVGPVYPAGSLLNIGMGNGTSTYTTYSNGDRADIDVIAHVEAGQRIIFSMLKSAGGNAYYADLETFKITYVEDVYDYTADFSGVQGMNNWYYNSASNTEYGTNNTSKYNTGVAGWTSASGGATWFTKDRITINSTNLAGIMFEAPKSGTIRIQQKFSAACSSSTTVLKYGIYKADKDESNTGTINGIMGSVYPVGSKNGVNMQSSTSEYTTYTTGNSETIDVTVHIEEGQQIIFSMCMNASGKTFYVYLDTFNITYVDDVYDYTADFSGVQGMNNWYYNSASNTEWGSNNTSVLSGSGDAAYWASATGKGIRYSKSNFTLTDTSVAGIMFKAPKSGTVRIQKKFAVSGGARGAVIKYSIFKADKDVAGTGTAGSDMLVGPIYPTGSVVGNDMANTSTSTYTTYSAGNTADIDVVAHVEAGQRIVFTMFNNNASGTFDVALDTFKITYVEDVYDYTADFSGIQGMNNWYYNSASNTEYGTNNTSKLNGNGDGAYWSSTSGGGTYLSNNKFSFTYNNVAGIMFEAPQDGTIRIQQAFSVSNVADEQYVKYSIYKANADDGTAGTIDTGDVTKALYPKSTNANKLGMTFASGNSTYELYSNNETDKIDIGTEVKAGERIIFHMVSTGGKGPVITLNNFKITYVDNGWEGLPRYEYAEGFSTKQQGPEWYYMSAEVGINQYKQLDGYNDTKARWQTSATSEYLTGAIGDNYIAPWSTSDAVLGFKAPYTGRVKIAAQNVYVYSKSIDGVRLSVLKGVEDSATENLYPGGKLDAWKEIRSGKVSQFKVTDVKVQKGEWLYFRVNANGTYDGDNLFINPCIQYMEIETEHDNVATLLSDMTYIEETKHTQAGHNMDTASFPMTARTSSGTSHNNVTSDDFALGLAHDTLSKGVYTIADGTLMLGKVLNGKEIDATGIYVKVKNGVKLEDVNGSRIKNLTVEVTGTTDALITTESVRDLKLMGWQVRYSGTSTGVELVKTMGTASNDDKADLVIDGLRFEGSSNVKGIKFTDAVHYGTLINSYITGVSDYAVCDDGSSTEGIYVGNCYLEGKVKLNKESGVAKYNTIKGNVDVVKDFGLVVMNDITGNVTVSNVQSTFVTKNKVDGNITLTKGNACAIVDNTATEITVTGGNKCIVEDNNGAGQENKPVETVKVDTKSTDHYGSNVYDQSVRNDVGVNEDLLPKVDNTTFVGVERKDYVNDAGVIKTVNEYLTEHAENDADVFLAPGAYNVNSVRITDKSNLNLYLYCSLFEAQTSRMSYFHLMLNNGTACSVRGLTVAYAEAALGQGTITEVGTDDNGKSYFIVESHPGYYPDLSINDYYLDGFYCLIYREGSTVPSGYANFTGGREYLGDNKTKFTDTGMFGEVQVGDTFACRVRGNRYIQFHDNTECLMEDITAYSSVEALVGDDGGNKNYYNRLAAVVGYGYEISSDDKQLSYWQNKGWITEYEGKYYGPQAIWSVSNFLNANGCLVGPQVTNYVANQRHDDGLNVHGVYSQVKYTSAIHSEVAYDGSLSSQGTVVKDFKPGDPIFIYNRATGEILLETTATSASVKTYDEKSGAYYYVVKVAKCDRKIEPVENVVIFNASAHGNGFLYDNCELSMSYPRGGVVKASGTIKHCNIKDIGGIGILVSPEINDTGFREAGYVDGLSLLYNNIENTNTMNASEDANSAISIQGHHKNIKDGYVRHKNITIQGNKFTNWGAHAIYVDSAENVKITDNIFVDDNALQDERSAIFVTGSKNVAIFDNCFPENFDTNKTMRVKVDGTNAVKTIIGIDKGTGDANNDSSTDVRDLVRTKKYLIGQTTEINADADYNEDGVYDVIDLNALRELLVGIFKIPWEK